MTCRRCHERQAPAGQAWCSPCKRDSRRRREARLALANAEANGGEHDAAAPVAPFVPWRDPDSPRPADLPAWADAYLVKRSETGLETFSAHEAGVSVREVRRLEDACPAFARECDEAEAYFGDVLEHRLSLLADRGKGNVLAHFGRLRAERPNKYHDQVVLKAQMQVEVTQGLTTDDVRAGTLMALRTCTDATLRAMLARPEFLSTMLADPEYRAVLEARLRTLDAEGGPVLALPAVIPEKEGERHDAR